MQSIDPISFQPKQTHKLNNLRNLKILLTSKKPLGTRLKGTKQSNCKVYTLDSLYFGYSALYQCFVFLRFILIQFKFRIQQFMLHHQN